PRQTAVLSGLERQITDKFDTLDAAVSLRRAKGPDPALEVVRFDVGNLAADPIRTAIASMKDEESRLLSAREAANRTILRRANLTISIDGLLAMAFLGVVYSVLGRHLRERAQAEAALRGAQDELESRVVERTVELTRANEALHTEIDERAR